MSARSFAFLLAALLVLGVAVYACEHASKPATYTTPTQPTSSEQAACFIDGHWHLPNPVWTPGKLCSKADPDYDGDRYAEHVPHCRLRAASAALGTPLAELNRRNVLDRLTTPSLSAVVDIERQSVVADT